MNAITIGAIVSYQGRCWLVTRMAGPVLHLITATTPNHYQSIDLPRNRVSLDLRSSESGSHEMYCSFKQQPR